MLWVFQGIGLSTRGKGVLVTGMLSPKNNSVQFHLKGI